MLVHYPVTVKFWRGVFNHGARLNRPLMRACSWTPGTWDEMFELKDFYKRTDVCEDCRAYVEAGLRLGFIHGFLTC